MKFQIINGPNLNLLGTREKHIYGDQTFEDFLEVLRKRFPDQTIDYFQSNVEGEIVNKLHEVGFSYDAIGSINTKVAEVHISNLYNREEYRHKSVITSKCIGLITGFGLYGYDMALMALMQLRQ